MKLALHRKTDLALAALGVLSRAQGPVKGTVLAKELRTSLGFLPQVMAPLVQEGWVASLRGPGGGYHLTGAAASVRLLDVIEVAEGPVDDGLCIMRDRPCSGDHSCLVHTVWVEARQVLRQGFAQIPALMEGSVK